MREIADSTPNSSSDYASGAKDFIQSAAYTFAQKPIDGVEQLLHHVNVDVPHLQLIDAPVHQNWQTTAGEVVGKVADVVVLGVGVGLALEGVGAACLLARLSLAEAGAIRGMAIGTMDALMSPVKDDNNYWSTKSRFVAKNAVEFAAKGAVAAPMARALRDRIGNELADQLSGGAKFGIEKLIEFGAQAVAEYPHSAQAMS